MSGDEKQQELATDVQIPEMSEDKKEQKLNTDVQIHEQLTFDEDIEPVVVQNELQLIDFVKVRSLPLGPLPRAVLLLLAGVTLSLLMSNLVDIDLAKWFLWIVIPIEIVLVDFLVCWKQFKNSSKARSEITISKDGIYVTTPEGSKSMVDWKVVVDVRRKADAVAIKVSKKPDVYYWIPRRRFSSDEAFDHFLDRAGYFWSHWLMVASTKPAEIREDEPKHRYVDVEMTVKDMLLCDYYLLRNLVWLSVSLFILAALEAPIFSTLVLYIVVAGLIVLAAPALGVYKKIKHHPNLLSGRSIISEEGLRPYNSSSGFDTTIDWTQFEKIYTKLGFLFFEMKGRRAVVVPLRCFPSSEASKEYIAAAQDWWAQTQARKLEKSS